MKTILRNLLVLSLVCPLAALLCGCAKDDPSPPQEPPQPAAPSVEEPPQPAAPSAPKKQSDEEMAEMVRQSILKMHKDMQTEDEAARQKAFDQFAPRESDMILLYGEEEGKKKWEDYGKFIAMVRQNTDKLQAEFARHIPITKIEIANVRTNETSGAHQEGWCEKVAPGVPMYEAITRYDEGRGASGSYPYFIIDGRVVFALKLN